MLYFFTILLTNVVEYFVHRALAALHLIGSRGGNFTPTFPLNRT